MTSKEELGKIKKLIFIMGEILVAESKQDISPEEAIQRIRKTCNKYGINGTGYETIKQDLDRLQYLENIEEEIGIDLTVVFSALKNGVWYFDDQGQLLHDYVWLVNNYVGTGVPDKLSFSFKTFLSGKILLFAGYGKEWALTEERLHENCIINIYAISSHS